MKFIVDELLRVPNASRHVPKVESPTVLFGSKTDIGTLPSLLCEKASIQRDSKGRKLRIDTPLLMGVIFSYPFKAIDEKYLAWESDTISFAQRKFGNLAVAVVRHEDEAFPHLHVLVHNNGSSVHALSPGYVDGRRSRSSLVKFQDVYQAEVGAKHGLARTGPQRARERSSIVHKRMKAEMEASQSELDKVRRNLIRVKEQRAADSADAEFLRKKLLRTQEELEISMAALHRVNSQRQALKNQWLELSVREDEVQKRAEALDEIENARFVFKLTEKTRRKSNP